MSTTPPPSELALGTWSTRANPHSSPSTFTLTRDSFVLTVLLNAPSDTDGFTLALFKSEIAVDSVGRVLILQPTDFPPCLLWLGSALPFLTPDPSRISEGSINILRVNRRIGLRASSWIMLSKLAFVHWYLVCDRF
ncbi:hypothetical protein JAAARDRAFT_641197 [Jaapia argillacea MUCL 33604]|uniref:Uncharacterized protein n=1 Tax=Jaapia argillacea MUCL 33604 TaxID=933084 RepID=A0A067P6R6_9AGAM|nr:hypothetical protein JAAARDRAFT_641197 [Jaapia argillacea MUCL 33604]